MADLDAFWVFHKKYDGLVASVAQHEAGGYITFTAKDLWAVIWVAIHDDYCFHSPVLDWTPAQVTEFATNAAREWIAKERDDYRAFVGK